ncbi:MAG: ferredoxin [Candidatus Nanopelagicales bacterium]|nr:ferredoxin [Candidatus Nanopelagicales bacterium]
MNIHIDWRRCQGHGVCSAALQELIALDEWGYPVVSTSEVPPGLEVAARAAQWTCPAAALRVSTA